MEQSLFHAMFLYMKTDYEKFKTGKYILDFKKQEFLNVGQIKISEAYKSFLKRWDYPETGRAFKHFCFLCGYYDYAEFNEKFELIETEIPDSQYVAVSAVDFPK